MGLHTSQVETHKKLKLYIYIYIKENVPCLKITFKSLSKISRKSPSELQALLEGLQKMWLVKTQHVHGEEQVESHFQREVNQEPEIWQ